MAEETITLTGDDLRRLKPGDLAKMVAAGGKIRASFVVQRADGSVKYDPGATPGDYHEHALEGGAPTS